MSYEIYIFKMIDNRKIKDYLSGGSEVYWGMYYKWRIIEEDMMRYDDKWMIDRCVILMIWKENGEN